jgi:hypothetical protein
MKSKSLPSLGILDGYVEFNPNDSIPMMHLAELYERCAAKNDIPFSQFLKDMLKKNRDLSIVMDGDSWEHIVGLKSTGSGKNLLKEINTKFFGNRKLKGVIIARLKKRIRLVSDGKVRVRDLREKCEYSCQLEEFFYPFSEILKALLDSTEGLELLEEVNKKTGKLRRYVKGIELV